MSVVSDRTEPQEPRIEDATRDDLLLAIGAIGSKAHYGGLLSCALAGIYAERARTDHVAAERDLAAERAANELMAAQFRVMQAEKEHGWREAERHETRADALATELDDLRRKIAQVPELCHWRYHPDQAHDPATHHSAFHFGDQPGQSGVCPYYAVAEVLSGRPDPRPEPTS